MHFLCQIILFKDVNCVLISPCFDWHVLLDFIIQIFACWIYMFLYLFSFEEAIKTRISCFEHMDGSDLFFKMLALQSRSPYFIYLPPLICSILQIHVLKLNKPCLVMFVMFLRSPCLVHLKGFFEKVWAPKK